MKLSKIEITYFRCFESLAMDLQPDVNVIVGANGAGKSSILDAIAIALYEVVAANGGGGVRQRKAQGAALLPTDMHIAPSGSSSQPARKSFVQVRATATEFYPVDEFGSPTVTGDPALLEWTEHIRYRAPASFNYDTSASDRLSAIHRYMQALWREIDKSPDALIPLPVVAYYRATRRMGGTPGLGDIFKLNFSRDKAFTDALDAAANFTAMCQWFYLRENAELRAQRNDRDREEDIAFTDLYAVREALKQVIQGLRNVYFDGSPPKLMVDIQENDNTLRSFELAQLSDGYRNLLAVVLDFSRRLALANPSWINPLEAPGILLIDEVELHLHPRWQQTVIPNLRAAFPNTQIILTTHSPAVLTTVRREQIHILGPDHQFEEMADDVGTYGADSSRVLAEVFGANSRPGNIETVKNLGDYLKLVESRQHSSDEAMNLRKELEVALGSSDPDLRRADLRIRQLEVMAKR